VCWDVTVCHGVSGSQGGCYLSTWLLRMETALPFVAPVTTHTETQGHCPEDWNPHVLTSASSVSLLFKTLYYLPFVVST